MDNDNNTTGSDLEQKKSYHTKALHLAIIQDNSENDYSKLKKKYVNGEKKLDEFNVEHGVINESENGSSMRPQHRISRNNVLPL